MSDDLRLIKLRDMEWSTRARRCFLAADEAFKKGERDKPLATLADLVAHTRVELLRLPNFGRKTLCEATDILASMGRHLKGDEPAKEPEPLFRVEETAPHVWSVFEVADAQPCAQLTDELDARLLAFAFTAAHCMPELETAEIRDVFERIVMRGEFEAKVWKTEPTS